MGFEDAVFRQQVLNFQQQFLVDQTGHVGENMGDGDDVWLQTQS